MDNSADASLPLDTRTSGHNPAEDEEKVDSLIPEDEFDRLVKQAEAEASSDYAGYKRKIFLFALLGYAYILFVPLLLFALLMLCLIIMQTTRHVYFIELQIAFGILIAILAYFKALWITIPPPEGVILSRSDYPDLFNLIDELSAEVKIKVDRVMVDDQFNAMVIQLPRLGLFGWYANYVVLGLPLMQALPDAHFKAVLTHEFGHISGNHSKGSAFIYNQRARLVQLLIAMQEKSQIAFALLLKFFNWYSPHFNASSLVIAREHEREADRLAASVYGGTTCGEALSLTEVKGEMLGEIWLGIQQESNKLPEPPELIYHQIGEKIASAPEREKALESLTRALSRSTDNTDTHPALLERLKVVSFPAEMATPDALLSSLPLEIAPERSAAVLYFGKKLSSLVQHFSDLWSNANLVNWKANYKSAQEARVKLLALAKKESEGALSIEDMDTKAKLVTVAEGFESAVPIYENILTIQPNHAVSNSVLGAYYLSRKNENGLSMLKVAARDKSMSGINACAMLLQYFDEKKMAAELAEYEKVWAEHQKLIELANRERQGFDRRDHVEPHDLTESGVEQVVYVLSRHKQIKEAYLYCKKMSIFPDERFYVLALVPKRNMGFELDDGNRQVEARISEEINFPGVYLIKMVDSNWAYLKEKALSIPDSIVYRG